MINPTHTLSEDETPRTLLETAEWATQIYSISPPLTYDRMHHWTTDGVAGFILEHSFVAGSLKITRKAVQEFIENVAAAKAARRESRRSLRVQRPAAEAETVSV